MDYMKLLKRKYDECSQQFNNVVITYSLNVTWDLISKDIL